jgi:hypothetical protein
LAFIEGKMDSVNYCQILAETLAASIEKCGLPEDFLL